jgi:hypothetical protein
VVSGGRAAALHGGPPAMLLLAATLLAPGVPGVRAAVLNPAGNGLARWDLAWESAHATGREARPLLRAYVERGAFRFMARRGSEGTPPRAGAELTLSDGRLHIVAGDFLARSVASDEEGPHDFPPSFLDAGRPSLALSTRSGTIGAPPLAGAGVAYRGRAGRRLSVHVAREAATSGGTSGGGLVWDGAPLEWGVAAAAPLGGGVTAGIGATLRGPPAGGGLLLPRERFSASVTFRGRALTARSAMAGGGGGPPCGSVELASAGGPARVRCTLQVLPCGTLRRDSWNAEWERVSGAGFLAAELEAGFRLGRSGRVTVTETRLIEPGPRTSDPRRARVETEIASRGRMGRWIVSVRGRRRLDVGHGADAPPGKGREASFYAGMDVLHRSGPPPLRRRLAADGRPGGGDAATRRELAERRLQGDQWERLTARVSFREDRGSGAPRRDLDLSLGLARLLYPVHLKMEAHVYRSASGEGIAVYQGTVTGGAPRFVYGEGAAGWFLFRVPAGFLSGFWKSGLSGSVTRRGGRRWTWGFGWESAW